MAEGAKSSITYEHYSPGAREVLEQLKLIVLSPDMSNESKTLAISLAYEAGFSEGRVSGARYVSDEMIEKFEAMKL